MCPRIFAICPLHSLRSFCGTHWPSSSNLHEWNYRDGWRQINITSKLVFPKLFEDSLCVAGNSIAQTSTSCTHGTSNNKTLGISFARPKSRPKNILRNVCQSTPKGLTEIPRVGNNFFLLPSALNCPVQFSSWLKHEDSSDSWRNILLLGIVCFPKTLSVACCFVVLEQNLYRSTCWRACLQ